MDRQLVIRTQSRRHRQLLPVIAVVLTILPIGCASSRPSPRDVAREFSTSEPPRNGVLHGGGEDMRIEQAVLDAVVRESARRGKTVLGVAVLPRGLHPYSVFVFTALGDRVDGVETAMFWGHVQGKWSVVMTPLQFQELERAAAALQCRTGELREPLLGPALVRWVSGEQLTCEGEWFTETSNAFAEVLNKVSAGAVQTYTTDPR